MGYTTDIAPRAYEWWELLGRPDGDKIVESGITVSECIWYFAEAELFFISRLEVDISIGSEGLESEIEQYTQWLMSELGKIIEMSPEIKKNVWIRLRSHACRVMISWLGDRKKKYGPNRFEKWNDPHEELCALMAKEMAEEELK